MQETSGHALLRAHRRVLGGLFILLVLVILIDLWVFRPRSGGWIALDLRGVLAAPALVLFGVHAAISTSLARRHARSPPLLPSSAGRLHVVSGLWSLPIATALLGLWLALT